MNIAQTDELDRALTHCIREITLLNNGTQSCGRMFGKACDLYRESLELSAAYLRVAISARDYLLSVHEVMSNQGNPAGTKQESETPQ